MSKQIKKKLKTTSYFSVKVMVTVGVAHLIVNVLEGCRCPSTHQCFFPTLAYTHTRNMPIVRKDLQLDIKI